MYTRSINDAVYGKTNCYGYISKTRRKVLNDLSNIIELIHDIYKNSIQIS